MAGGINAGGYGPFNSQKTDEQQTVRVTGSTGGTFTLTFDGQTTAPIAWNATAAQIGPQVLEAPKLLKEPAASRVYQRDRNDRADLPIVLSDEAKDAEIESVVLQNMMTTGGPGFQSMGHAQVPGGLNAEAYPFRDGKLIGVPTGGPYSVFVVVRRGEQAQALSIGPVYVGDLKVQMISEYRGEALTGRVLRIENKGTQEKVLTEAQVAPASALAASIAEPKLAPGRVTTAYLVSRNGN